MKDKDLYEFGDFRLNVEEQLLSKHGEALSITPKVFSLLKFLIENHGNVVTKDELMETVWEGNLVEDSNLTFTMRQLRIALDDDFRNPLFIETIPRRGYRFIGEVKFTEIDSEVFNVEAVEFTEEEKPQPARNFISLINIRNVLIAVMTAVVLFFSVGSIVLYNSKAAKHPVNTNEQKTLAVLSFTNLNPNSETDYLGFAFADTLNTKLTSMRNFKVFPSSLMAKYRSPQEFLSEQKADFVVTGTYLKEEGKLKINSQVFDVLNNETLFQDNFELDDEELSKTSEIIARRLINELRLRPQEISKYADMTAINPIAYNHFLKGIEQYSKSQLSDSIENLKKAVAIEPDFAVAWDKLGDSYLVSASTHFGGEEYYQKAERCYRKAISLDETNILPQLHLTNILIETNRTKEAVDILLKLSIKEPENPMVWWELSYAYRFVGKLEKSIEAGEKAHQVDPGFFLNASAPNYYLYVGDYEKFKNAVSRRTDSSYVKFYQGFAEYHLQNYEAAKSAFDEAYSLDSNSMQTQIGKAFSFMIAGEKEKARDLLLKIEKRIRANKVSDGEGIYKVAQAFAVLGENAIALQLFDLAVEKGFYCYPYFQKDPLIESLRNDKNFVEIMARSERYAEQFN